MPWVEKSFEVGEASKEGLAMDLQGQKDMRVKDGALETSQNHFGVSLEDDEEDNMIAVKANNDFDVIVFEKTRRITQEGFDTKTLGGKLLAFNVVDQMIMFMFKTFSYYTYVCI